jgi:hypothetical protein
VHTGIICALQIYVRGFGFAQHAHISVLRLYNNNTYGPTPNTVTVASTIFVVYSTVRLTSIDHPQIGGAYISGLCASNFIFVVCVESSSEWRTPHNHWICIEHIGWLRYKLLQNLHRFRDVIFENFRVRMTSLYLTKLFSLSNFDCLYLRQYWSYEQASKHRSASFQPEKGFWTSSGCHCYSFNDPQGTPSQMYRRLPRCPTHDVTLTSPPS